MRASGFVYASVISAALAAAFGLSTSTTQADTEASPGVPVLRVDPNWPKTPLPVAGDFGTPPAISSATGKPKPWVTGEVAGTCVDSHDHIFTVNRGNLVSPEGTGSSPLTAVPSPMVIEFDPEGNVVNAWDARTSTGFVVQAQIHGCFVDYQDNLWIAGN